jgi:hypothetical protein
MIYRLHKSICIADMQWRSKAEIDKNANLPDQVLKQRHCECLKRNKTGRERKVSFLSHRTTFLYAKR